MARRFGGGGRERTQSTEYLPKIRMTLRQRDAQISLS
ncbi:hypothetical protein PDIG_60370 [Penicillium digitatum PHI26]|uniref:Uncharacterized protein n=2 Tax=Penicillium digitatum TaxID=36651 RepID=K9FKE7_PEND2|nr:hypothetical protein PDIP_69780 [Penicillium digitatum Pd1]EKV08143.1 hypothetical protein PDIP_69780 [Penicillium digitatum Pd1]EKV09714.1 hypothetical protein PDIG_60370 [Penicillium digitatum PHI26]